MISVDIMKFVTSLYLNVNKSKGTNEIFPCSKQCLADLRRHNATRTNIAYCVFSLASN